ncbi:MAG: phosphate/phosphite/phosphonate ABC transporter substrate-binding protein [Proteobacteria bacterium]|nr:phosphate/phosphite/phosphonate ABC transporter substrate-binding protein [Pseudomonadota bacterium]
MAEQSDETPIPGIEHAAKRLDEQTQEVPLSALLDEKYRLGRLLGEGGMGAVYEAEHTGLGTRVAVKLLNENFVADPRAILRFRREARAAAAIRHENIVAVYDTGTTSQGVPFLVMELLDGESLSAFLRRERATQPTVAAAVTCQLLAGLAAAHASGVIHRDLKPGNILLARMPNGLRVVKILDFGISKFHTDALATDLTAQGAVVGTPRFMSPEQARGEADIDARADLYAVGVLLYRMVTGRLPFGGATQPEVLAAIVNGNLVAPRQLRPSIPEALEHVILKALAGDRAQRYQTAGEFLAELQRAMPEVSAGDPVEITLPSSGDAHEPGARNPSIPALIGVEPSLVTASETPMAREQRRRIESRRRALRAVTAALVVASIAAALWYAARPADSRLIGDARLIVGLRRPGAPLRMGVTQYLPAAELLAEHRPLLQHLVRQLDRPVELRVFEDYVDLAAKLREGQLELAALSAYAYVRAAREGGGLDLLATHVTSGGASYEGYIIARADSPIQRLEDLRGRVFCYTNPASTSGYLYPRAVLRRAGIDPDAAFKATRFMGDHRATLQALYHEVCDGAAVYASIVFDADRHGIPAQQIRILASTDRIPYDAYCTGAKEPAALKQRLRRALLALKAKTPLAERVLRGSGPILGFIAASDADYDSVRQIDRYLDPPRKLDPPRRPATP